MGVEPASEVNRHKARAHTATHGLLEASSSATTAIALCVSHQQKLRVLLLLLSKRGEVVEAAAKANRHSARTATLVSAKGIHMYYCGL